MNVSGATSDSEFGQANDPIVRLAREAVAKVVSASRDGVAREQALGHIPSPQITDLAHALADTDQSRADAMIADLLDAGVGVQDLCLEHLAPAARELGAWWERDTMQFADVTMAAARIQSILRTISPNRAGVARAGDYRALFAAVPGETHTLGVIMAADYFRRLGWDVGLLIGMDHGELWQNIESDDRKVIGLSCAGRHSAPALHLLVNEIRRARPDMGIVVSGHVLNDSVAMADLPAVDGIVDGLARADEVLQAVMERCAVRSRESASA